MSHSLPAAVLSRLASNELFASLDQSTWQSLAPELVALELRAGEPLFRQGDASDDGLYVVISGQLQASIRQPQGPEQAVGLIAPGEIIGEMELLTREPRAASVRAVNDAQLVRLPGSAFDRMSAKAPEALAQIGEVIFQRIRRNQLAELLPRFFGPLDLEALAAIEQEAEWVHLPRGDVLMRQGDAGDCFYILVSGRLQAAVRDDQGRERVVGEILRGESVGEMEIFTGEARAASVYAARDADLVRFSRASFDRLLADYPGIMMHTTRLVIGRLRRTMQAAPPAISATNVVLIPVDRDVPQGEVARKLSAGLNACATCLHINSESVDLALNARGISQLPESNPNSLRLRAWLDEQEAAHRFVVYEVDPEATAWTRRALERADRLLFLAEAGGTPVPAALQQLLAESGAGGVRRELVLLHPAATTRPTNTRSWLHAIGGIERHYHVHADSEDDFARVARFLSGRALGLALGGGGARGFAHIGVLRAMAELGIEADAVGGTSFGSLISAGHAIGMSWEAIYAVAHELVHSKKTLDYTLPLASFIAGKHFSQALDDLLGDIQIEDAWIDYFCISTNLTQAREMVHRSGSLRKYVRASCSLPGAFVPVVEGEDLLVDGVVVNNLPVDVMKRVCEGGPVIGIDVSAEEDLKGEYETGPSLSGWQVLRRRLSPFTPAMKTPPLFGTIMRVAELASVRSKRRQYEIADLMIHPEVDGYDILQLSAFEEIVQLGYEAGLASLGAWQQNRGE